MTSEPRPGDAVEHLQRAALEVIAASRIVLDGLEALVRDPSPLVAAAAAAAAMGRAAAEGRSAGSRSETTEDDVPDAPRVQRIRIS